MIVKYSGNKKRPEQIFKLVQGDITAVPPEFGATVCAALALKTACLIKHCSITGAPVRAGNSSLTGKLRGDILKHTSKGFHQPPFL